MKLKLKSFAFHLQVILLYSSCNAMCHNFDSHSVGSADSVVVLYIESAYSCRFPKKKHMEMKFIKYSIIQDKVSFSNTIYLQ